ncbi:MAG: hypothetical protein Q8Q31_00505 [Nanoarchaeota archaeon]|nr:hypothetical protein [Nanoarchaeota archaeon]
MKGPKSIIITKRIAKHGRQSVIVIPKDLEGIIKPGMLTQLKIDLIHENLEEKENA